MDCRDHRFENNPAFGNCERGRRRRAVRIPQSRTLGEPSGWRDGGVIAKIGPGVVWDRGVLRRVEASPLGDNAVPAQTLSMIRDALLRAAANSVDAPLYEEDIELPPLIVGL